MATKGSSRTVTCGALLLAIFLLSGCSGGGNSSGGDTGTPPPTAHASLDEMVPVGTPATLDGSASESPTGLPLSYQWALTAKPSGSAAFLTTPNSVRSTFTPDLPGTYTATLVVSAIGVASQPAAVSTTAVTGNVAPQANAGPDGSAVPGRPITLDGRASRDANRTALTYSWRILEQPQGSNPTLANATSATPTFTADAAGRYVLALTCSDGSLTSAVDQVVIVVATGNLTPVAKAGHDQTVMAGQLVTLNGTASSDPNGDPLTYHWCLKGKPEGSIATLSGANAAQPSFTPDVAGSYVFCLTVNDGKTDSPSDTVVVEAHLPSSVGAVLQAYVKPSNTTVREFRFFGESVALDGNTLVVGASDPSCATGVNGNQSNSDCPQAGAVYVFARNGEAWTQQALLKASNTDGGDNFGASVSLSGDTLVVGAPNEASCTRGLNADQANNACPTRGAVYVFTRAGNTWSQQAYVKPSNTDPTNAMFFGQTVSISGNTFVAGAPQEASCDIGINGNQFDTRCAAAGAAYIFTRSDTGWTQEAYVKASNGGRIGSLFGSYVALDGETVAVGAPGEESCTSGINGSQLVFPTCTSAGAVYVFTRTAGVWTQQAYMKASNTSADDQFGISVALKADTLIAGARLEDSCTTGINGNQADEGCSGAGAVYIFTRANDLWSQAAYVKAIPPDARGSSFGSTIAFDGTTLAVSELDSNCAKGFNPSPGSNDCFDSGMVYLFSRTATSWTQRASVKATNTDAFDSFGTAGGGTLNNAIAINGNTVAIGAPAEDSCATGINGNQNDNSCTGFPPDFGDVGPPPIFGAGAAYVYVLQ
jgi:hypothetical protein